MFSSLKSFGNSVLIDFHITIIQLTKLLQIKTKMASMREPLSSYVNFLFQLVKVQKKTNKIKCLHVKVIIKAQYLFFNL